MSWGGGGPRRRSPGQEKWEAAAGEDSEANGDSKPQGRKGSLAEGPWDSWHLAGSIVSGQRSPARSRHVAGLYALARRQLLLPGLEAGAGACQGKALLEAAGRVLEGSALQGTQLEPPRTRRWRLLGEKSGIWTHIAQPHAQPGPWRG